MEKLQYDSFYKFLVSLGLVLIITPFIGVYYLLNYSNENLLTVNKYTELSQKSLGIIEKKENILNLFLTLAPYIFIFTTILGIFLLIYGIIKWKNLQKEIDEQTTIKTKVERTQLKKLTANEVLQKIESEEEINTKYKKQIYNRIQDAIMAESFCFEYLSNQLSKDYIVEQNVRIDNYIFDIVALSKKNKNDLIYEIKYYREKPDLHKYKYVLDRLEKSKEVYEKSMNKTCEPTLLIIIPSSSYERITRYLKNYQNQVLNSNIKIEYLKISEITENYINESVSSRKF